jgi:hypothetical protein
MRAAMPATPKQQHCKPAADQSALQAQHEEVTLKTGRQLKPLLAPMKCSHPDNRAISRHRAAGLRRSPTAPLPPAMRASTPIPPANRGPRHGAHAIDPGAMVVEHRAGDALAQRLAQWGEIDARCGSLSTIMPRHRQIVEREPTAEPGSSRPADSSLVIRSHLTMPGRRGPSATARAHVGVEIAALAPDAPGW